MNPDSAMSANNFHLTDEQFSGLLLGDDLDIAARAHLLDCTLCRQEAEKFTSSVNLFSKTSLAWADTKPAKRSLLPVFRSREKRAMFTPLVWALAATLLVIIEFPAWNHNRNRQSESSVAQTAGGDSAAQVAEDNQLLQSVNVVLSSNEGSPLPESRLADYARPASRADSRLK